MHAIDSVLLNCGAAIGHAILTATQTIGLYVVDIVDANNGSAENTGQVNDGPDENGLEMTDVILCIQDDYYRMQ